MIEKGKVLRINERQVIQLPSSVAFPNSVEWVDIVASGRTWIISPEGSNWDEWFDGSRVSDEFMVERDQPAEYLREGFAETAIQDE